MNNIAIVEGVDKWAVLFNRNNSPISWKKILRYEGQMVFFEDGDQHPKRLVFECESALSAQETFEAMIEVEERIACECL